MQLPQRVATFRFFNMQYLVHKSRKNEIPSRKEYLYDIFKLYFWPIKTEGDYIVLAPMGASTPDIMFITGHTDEIEKYLKTFFINISEKMIVITSCMGNKFKKYAKQKTIYIPDIDSDFCELRDGQAFGFGFYISDAELNFYNTKGNIATRIKSAYKKLH